MLLKKFGTKGQVSLEYLTMTGALLVIVAFLAGYALISYQETLEINTLQKSASDLRETINQVHSLGEGNTLILNINLPNDVNEIQFQNNAFIIVTLNGSNLIRDIIETDANLAGNISSKEGLHTIRVTNNNGVVTLDEI